MERNPTRGRRRVEEDDAGVRGWITSLDFRRFEQRHGMPR